MLTESVSFWIQKGNAFHFARKYPAALQAFECACTLDPGNPDIICGIGIVLCDLGRYQEAEEAFGRVFDLGYSSPKTFAGLCLALNFQHKSTKAEQIAEDGLVCYPDNVQVKVRLATVKETLRKYGDAMRIFSEALKVAPDNIEALAGVGRGFMRKQRYAEALHYLTQAIGKEGNIVPALCTLVSAYVQMQDARKATEIVDRISEIDPEVAADFRKLVEEFCFSEGRPVPVVRMTHKKYLI